MYLEADTLDDLLNNAFTKLLDMPANIKASKGYFSEIVGASLKLKNPRARLSQSLIKGKPIGALGELFWYLSGSDELQFIQYYLSSYHKNAEENGSINGAYGPRLFNLRGINQISNVIALLNRKQSSRQAVVQLFSAEDIDKVYQDVPCTCTLQFLIRDQHLHLICSMRSNDCFIGFPHDVFAFTMIQEIVARELDVEIGTYHHYAASFHLYEGNRKSAEKYLSEGWQSTKQKMPPMPIGTQQNAIKAASALEAEIRLGKDVNLDESGLEKYWLDLLRLLQIYALEKREQLDKIEALAAKMSDPIYNIFIQDRLINQQTKAKNQ